MGAGAGAGGAVGGPEATTGRVGGKRGDVSRDRRQEQRNTITPPTMTARRNTNVTNVRTNHEKGTTVVGGHVEERTGEADVGRTREGARTRAKIRRDGGVRNQVGVADRRRGKVINRKGMSTETRETGVTGEDCAIANRGRS